MESGIRAEAANYHRSLRDLAQKRNDFVGYIEHNNEYQRITEEVRGRDATLKMAMMEAERNMEGERREREKERTLLYGALPESVANRMLRGEDVSGDHFDHASVMFLDVVGFTTYSHDLEPRVVAKLLDDVFNALDELCDRHNVTKIKTIGDAYLAVAFPEEDRSTEQKISFVALDIQQLYFTWPNQIPLQFRIGLHSGSVVAGVIGKKRLQYDVWGDTVNVAIAHGEHERAGADPRELELRSRSTSATSRSATSRSATSRWRQFPVPRSLFPDRARSARDQRQRHHADLLAGVTEHLMRTFEEIKTMDQTGNSINDVEALLRFAEELDALAYPQAEAEASRSRGMDLFLRDDYPAALSYYHRAMELYEELGDQQQRGSRHGKHRPRAQKHWRLRSGADSLPSSAGCP